MPARKQPGVSWLQVQAAVFTLWFAVAAALGGRLLLGMARLWQLERRCRATPVHQVLAEALSLAAKDMRPAPRLLVGPAGSMPMVWGLRRPRLMLPEGAESWPAEKLRSVLLHELAHLRRGDPAAILLAHEVRALHWFNPLAWRLMRRLREDQERACDDSVIHHGVLPSDYARHLLEFTGCTRLAPGVGLCALTMARAEPMEDRLAAILNPAVNRRPLGRWSITTWLLGSAALALPLAMLAQAATAQRGRIVDRHGVVLVEASRAHPFKALAAHALGCFRPSSSSGLEKQADETLAAGHELKLTLDARVQSIAERAMIDAGVGRGAVVILDPRNGDVLALASLPNYNPNKWMPHLAETDLKRYLQNSASPLTNRAVKPFAPGASFKLLTALAGARKGLNQEPLECTGSVTYANREFKCWIASQGHGHGTLGLAEAIKVSCGSFFYQLGNNAGLPALEEASSQVGFGTAYGLLPEENAGVFPSRQWMALNRPNERANMPGRIANTSSGQGDVLATPLQMAVLAATVANAGKVPEPRLVDPGAPSRPQAEITADASQLEPLRQGMLAVVNDEGGTGRKAQSKAVQIAGKSGTAQFWRKEGNETVKDNHSWFIGFAPYDHPTLAFAILVQGGRTGGGVCAPIAKRMVEQTLALPADGSGPVQVIEEQEGHFKLLDTVSYPGTEPQ